MARILVADTDKSVRDLVRLRLSAWGHDVVSFAAVSYTHLTLPTIYSV